MLLSISEKIKLGQEFRQWASALRSSLTGTDHETLAGFRVWATQLSDLDAGLVALDMAELCQMPGFDLTWFRENLRNSNHGSPPAKMMIYFGLAQYESQNMRYLNRLLGWLHAPRHRQNREFGWQIYLRLVEAGYTRPPGEFLWEPPHRRYPVIEAAIRAAFKQDYPMVLAFTREVVFLEDNQLLSRFCHTC